MKKVLTTRFAAIALSIILSATFTTAMAINEEPNTPSVELKFAGKLNDQPVFQLKVLNSTNTDNFTVTIEDESGYVLHKAALKPGTKALRFVLSDEVENVPLRFTVYDKVNNKTFVYEVNQKTQVEDKFLVTKL